MSVDFDWAGYQRIHSNRRNLIIHLIAVPLFTAAFLASIVCVIRGYYAAAAIALIGAFAAMALQGMGHALEAQAPVPFSGPGNFLRRWFSEQLLVFPAFLLMGRWWRQFKASATSGDVAA